MTDLDLPAMSVSDLSQITSYGARIFVHQLLFDSDLSIHFMTPYVPLQDMDSSSIGEEGYPPEIIVYAEPWIVAPGDSVAIRVTSATALMSSCYINAQAEFKLSNSSSSEASGQNTHFEDADQLEGLLYRT